MQIQVKLDVTKPLAHRKRVKIGEEEAVGVRLAYERLPKFCYYYGIIGHYHCEFSQWISVKDHISEEVLPYGQWL